MPAPSMWYIPYQRNPFFTGREDVLVHLHRVLHTENSVALSHPQGISGLGGIGKTQTALEYAYRYHSEYNAVFWVRADSVASLISSLVELANALQLPERNEKDQEIVVQAVLRWLRLHTGWLLIYDNIDDLSLAEPFLPKAGPGHLLFTTRAHGLGGLAQRLDLQKMVPEVGALLILRRASFLALKDPFNKADLDDQNIACAISEEVDGLPLALDQAGAYVSATSCSLRDYLTLYQTRCQNLLQERGSFDQDYPASVATTWSLSFEKVSLSHPAAAALLNFCAFLSPDAIPESIITCGAPYLGNILASAVADPIQFDLLCKEVLKYSLFQREPDTETLTIHRLVQAVLQDHLSSETCVDWKQRVVLAVNEASPDVGDVRKWAVCEQWVPHALLCATWIEQEQISSREAAHLLNVAGYYLDERGRYRETEPLYVHALSIHERQLGMEHPDTASSFNNLAALYESQGKYGEAEPLYKRALWIREKQLGEEHPDTAGSLNNLAGLYRHRGRYAEAEALYKGALLIYGRQLGAEHSGTARCLNNLAALYESQGKYEEAEPLYEHVLTISERQMGTEHPWTATSLHNLAGLYRNQEKYEKAEGLYKRALAIRERQLGAEHPDTAGSLNALALLYFNQGKYEKAEGLYKRALAIRERQLGAEHPSTAGSLNNLASLYWRQGKYEEAKPLFRQALAIRERALGSEHPDVAQSLSWLAIVYAQQHEYNKAELLYKRAFSIYIRVLGSGHPDTQSIQEQYTFLRTLGQNEEADAIERHNHEGSN